MVVFEVSPSSQDGGLWGVASQRAERDLEWPHSRVRSRVGCHDWGILDPLDPAKTGRLGWPIGHGRSVDISMI